MRKKYKRRTNIRGSSTNKLILSAYQGTNSLVFPKILELYVPEKSIVADVTYGKGVFWKRVAKDKYTLEATDLKKRVDCRALPYKGRSMDAVVFDPPYMHTADSAHKGHQNFEGYYANNLTLKGAKKNKNAPKYHEAILDLYFGAAKEARRVLKDGGVYIVKCQDEVCSNRQRLTHVEITNELLKRKWIVEDLFVVMRLNAPGVSRVIKQMHARKNHSYFLIFRKPIRKKRKKTKKHLRLKK